MKSSWLRRADFLRDSRARVAQLPRNNETRTNNRERKNNLTVVNPMSSEQIPGNPNASWVTSTFLFLRCFSSPFATPVNIMQCQLITRQYNYTAARVHRCALTCSSFLRLRFHRFLVSSGNPLPGSPRSLGKSTIRRISTDQNCFDNKSIVSDRSCSRSHLDSFSKAYRLIERFRSPYK